MSSCPHRSRLSTLSPPKLSQSVHREECTQCFDDQDGQEGIDVCLVCFNGGCRSAARHHARTHVVCSGHAFTLTVVRRPKPGTDRGDDEPPAKMTKLAIVQEREEDRYEHQTAVRCWTCDPLDGRVISADDDETTKRLTDGIMESLSSARQSEVKAWEEEIVACEHALLLEQAGRGSIPAAGLAHCASCDLTSNLWLCLTCGALGCGRAQYGGTGGNGHALAHFSATEHPICVKLGTITPEGGADIYCYACNDSRLDPELTTHLAAFGINVISQKKTEKSMTELQIEQNLTFDFSLTAEDGSALRPVFGPGSTGLRNLGNSCYMASVLQTVFSLGAFQERYYRRPSPDITQDYVSDGAATHWMTCVEALPAGCLECQLLKLGDGLLSGRYSRPHDEKAPSDPLGHAVPEHTPWQTGLRPTGFKTLVGKGHAEFATMRQQDAEEFFGHFLTVLRRYNHQARGGGPGQGEPTEIFSFGLEQRLECLGCRRVRYRVDDMDVLSLGVPAAEMSDGDKTVYAPVSFGTCLDLFLGQTGQETLEYECEAGCGKTRAVRRTQFARFPEVLVVHAKRFRLKNWVPTKLDIAIVLPEGELVLDGYLGRGLQAGEEELPSVDGQVLSQLEGMGFTRARCEKALSATGNAGAEAAMEWLLSHVDDDDDDGDHGQVAMLAEMGFTEEQARTALAATDGNPERAIEWLFSHPDKPGDSAESAPGPARYQLCGFISHKGPSVHSGHYVAHVLRDDGEWVFFNDEKVVVADRKSVEELKKSAYLYVFRRT